MEEGGGGGGGSGFISKIVEYDFIQEVFLNVETARRWIPGNSTYDFRILPEVDRIHNEL